MIRIQNDREALEAIKKLIWDNEKLKPMYMTEIGADPMKMRDLEWLTNFYNTNK